MYPANFNTFAETYLCIENKLMHLTFVAFVSVCKLERAKATKIVSILKLCFFSLVGTFLFQCEHVVIANYSLKMHLDYKGFKRFISN